MSEILHKDLIGEDIHELRITIGSSAPSFVPLFVGQGYYDIVNKKFYVSQGTATLSDWVTTDIPPFLAFTDTRTITWTSNVAGNQVTYSANVEEAELILTSANVTDFSNAVLTIPQIISLLADQHTRLIMRTGGESQPTVWNPVYFNGLELDSDSQKIRLSQDLSDVGTPTFDEITLTVRAKTPILTLTPDGVPASASLYLDADKGMIARGYAGSTSSFTLQNEAGTDVLSNPVSSNQLIAPSLAAGAGAPGIVHSNANGLLSASKVVDVDVDVAAAIQGTKIVPDFGSQDITTTGSVLVDTIESNTDDIGILTGNTNKNISIGTGSGYNTITLGGINSTVNISGATYTTPIEYVSEDKNIVVNFNASGQDSQDSGVYVQEEYAGAHIDLLDATWQSGNTVRYVVDGAGSGVDGLTAGEYIRVTGFVNSQNNGTFKVLTVDPAYIDAVNPKRTDASLDETGVAASSAARLLLNGYVHVGSTRMSWEVRAPAHLGIIELKPQAVAKTLLLTSESADNVTVKFNTNLTIDQDLQKTSAVEFAELTVSDLTTGVLHADVDGNVSSSLIVNADVDGAAAISGTKIVPDFGSQSIQTTADLSVGSVKITAPEPMSGANLFKSAANGLTLRGIAGTTSQFKMISELGTDLVTITDTGATTFHALTNGVVKTSSGLLSSSLLVNADVDAAAAIDGSKIQEASGTNAGVVSTTAQTFSGNKTFNNDVSLSSFSVAGVVHNNASGLLSTSLIVDADIDAAAAISASKLANQPAGNISSTTVQTAINELDLEKVAKAGDSLTGSLSFSNGAGIESTSASSTLNVGSGANTSVLNLGSGTNVSTINIGNGTSATVINIGSTGDTINITGTLNTVNVTDMEVADKNIVINKNGSSGSSDGAGLNIEENSSIVGYVKVGNSRESWMFKPPAKDGYFVLTPSTNPYLAELRVPSITTNAIYTLPLATDILVGRDSTDELSNKTLFNPIIDAIIPHNVDETIEITSTAALTIPTGTTANRSTFTGQDGMVRYNTTLSLFEGHTNGEWAPLAGNAVTDQITQTSHGFVAGDVLFLNGATYAKGIATATNTAQIVGVVNRVIDANNFELTLSGDVVIAGWGLVPGTTYYLSATSAGMLAATEPTVVGQASTQVGIARTASALYVDIKRPLMVGSTNARTTIAVYNNMSTNILDISGYTSFVLEGELNVTRSPSANQRAYYTVEAAKNGAGVWELDVRYTGDDILYTTLPTWSVSLDHLTLTMPLVTDFVNSALTYSLNAPSIGASLRIDSNIVYTNYRSVTSAYTVAVLDDFVSARGASPFAITLPSAVGLIGKTFIIKNSMNAGVLLTVNTTSSQTIDGSTSVVLSRYSSLHVISNGANWEIF